MNVDRAEYHSYIHINQKIKIMKFQLTKQAELELEVINAKFEVDDDAYDQFNEREIFITDAGLYADDAYVEASEYDDLNEYCKAVQESEYDNDDENYVLNKINKMIAEGVLIVS